MHLERSGTKILHKIFSTLCQISGRAIQATNRLRGVGELGPACLRKLSFSFYTWVSFAIICNDSGFARPPASAGGEVTCNGFPRFVGLLQQRFFF